MSMFCFQCEQTAGGKACTVAGACGKKESTANLQDGLTGKLIALSRAVKDKGRSAKTDELVLDALFTAITNVSFDDAQISALAARIDTAVADLGGYGSYPEMDLNELWQAGDEDTRSLKSLLLFGMRGMAAYAHHAAALGKTDNSVNEFFYKGLRALGAEHTVPELLDLNMEFGKVNLACMELLDAANTGAYGTPEPTKVTTNVAPGPFIVVSGHDLLDLKQLLLQTEGQGVDVYTHGEMLPCHAYPDLKKHKHLKGNFGTAWQNQQKEFADLPGVVLYTTNCIMPPRPSYIRHLATTAEVGWPGVRHIAADETGHKDFSSIIQQAIDLGGWTEETPGAYELMTGFAHHAVMSVADKLVDAVKSGAVKHIYLVGGCDGAKLGRDYYTQFVEKTPKDTLVLTLACGKFRFNHLQDQLGDIGGIPRLLDMGQCNDAYSAIQVALALSKVFNCGVNDLPLSLVLSWYEQKAVCILLTLLSIGIKNIRIGPTLPAFVSPTVLNVLVEKFGLTPISTPDEDLKALAG